MWVLVKIIDGKSMSEQYNLTPVELELMEILWKIGQGTVHDVLAHLPANRRLAYTSVSTILDKYAVAPILVTEKLGRQHIYIPTLSKQVFASHSIKKIVNQMFSGNPVELVAYLMNKDDLSIEEITTLQKMLDAKKKELI